MGEGRYERHEVADLAQWRVLVDRLLLPLRIESDHPSFGATMESVSVHGIRLFTILAGPHRLRRTERQAGSGADPWFTISLQIEGTSTIAQRGHRAVLEPGDFSVYDSTTPYTRTFDGRSLTLVVMFPQQMVSLPPKALAQIAGQRIGGDTPAGAIVSSFLLGVARNLPALDSRLGLGIAASLVDLCTAAFADALGYAAPQHSKLEQTMAVREWIMGRLGDPDLSPGRIAEAHYISTRQLHLLFSEQGTTVSAWIRGRRLEMARRDLADPARAGEPVGAVAERWGFRDPRYFSRVFRAAYGSPPAAYRRTG